MTEMRQRCRICDIDQTVRVDIDMALWHVTVVAQRQHPSTLPRCHHGLGSIPRKTFPLFYFFFILAGIEVVTALHNSFFCFWAIALHVRIRTGVITCVELVYPLYLSELDPLRSLLPRIFN